MTGTEISRISKIAQNVYEHQENLRHGRWKDFFRGGSSGLLQRVTKMNFPKGAHSGEISFIFRQKYYIGKYQISKMPCTPLPMPVIRVRRKCCARQNCDNTSCWWLKGCKRKGSPVTYVSWI